MGECEFIPGFGVIRRTRFDDAQKTWYAEVPLEALVESAQLTQQLTDACKAVLRHIFTHTHPFLQNEVWAEGDERRVLVERMQFLVAKASEHLAFKLNNPSEEATKDE